MNFRLILAHSACANPRNFFAARSFYISGRMARDGWATSVPSDLLMQHLVSVPAASPDFAAPQSVFSTVPSVFRAFALRDLSRPVHTSFGNLAEEN